MDAMMTEINSDISVDSDTNEIGVPKNQENTLKAKSKFNSTYVKPIGIIGAFIFLGLLIFTIKAMTPEPVVKTEDGGEANAIRVNPEIDGRNELTVEQAKYLSQKQLMEAEREAGEGTTNAALISRAEISSSGANYQDTTSTNYDAVTKKYVGVPKTYAQLKAENDAANGQKYSVSTNEEGYIQFIDRQTGVVNLPIDKATYDKNDNVVLNLNPNATYNYSNENYSGDGSGSAPQDGSNGANGGDNGGGQQATASSDNSEDNQQQQAPKAPDPIIEAKRLALGSDYERYIAQDEALKQQEDALKQQQQERYQQLQESRNDAASNALNQAIQDVRASVGSTNRYTPQSYYNQGGNYGNQGGQGGQGGNNGQNGYSNTNSQNGQNGQNGSGYTSGVGYGGSANGNRTTFSLPPNGFNDKTDIQTVADRGQYQKNDTYTVGGNGSASAQGEVLDQRLPSNIIRAGTKWQAVVTNSVNTDEGTRVTAEIVGGKFSGAQLYGTVQPSGRNVGIVWDTLAPTNPKKPLIPIQAYATTIGSNKTAVSNDVTYHYAQNYGVKALTSAMRGYGEALADSQEEVYYNSDGKVIATKKGKADSEEIRAEILRQFGNDLSSDIAKLGDRPPTYKVPMGKVVNVVLSNNLDINSTSSTIGR